MPGGRSDLGAPLLIRFGVSIGAPKEVTVVGMAARKFVAPSETGSDDAGNNDYGGYHHENDPCSPKTSRDRRCVSVGRRSGAERRAQNRCSVVEASERLHPFGPRPRSTSRPQIGRMGGVLQVRRLSRRARASRTNARAVATYPQLFDTTQSVLASPRASCERRAMERSARGGRL